MAGWRNYCALYLFGPLDKSGLKDFKTKRRRLMTKHLFAFALALLAGVPGYFIFLDRVPPYVELNAIAVTEVVPPGGKFKMVLVGIVNRHCYGVIRREFIDSEKVIHAIAPVPPLLAGTRGKETELSRVITVPSNMAQGDAVYIGYPEYQCNPFQWVWPIKLKPTVVKFKIAGEKISNVFRPNLAADSVRISE